MDKVTVENIQGGWIASGNINNDGNIILQFSNRTNTSIETLVSLLNPTRQDCLEFSAMFMKMATQLENKL